ncbi:MAG: tRNA (adenosine(37)-N6)-threonylcarbamoyltransferase complex ATPase subunit type 1 TsaE [Armatimonadetes bacterium]|nr:tRNA (adenosine(37)-N6)-threonylcarbamoyltransferase complex ATPase subunit type 1 TsaE [Armatimonadota bacterium]
MVVETDSAACTRALGEALGRSAEPNTVIGLRGPLGAGKSTLAQGIARGLGVTEPVSSPTFNLVQEYAGRLPFWHVDAYRIRSLDEIIDLSLPELLQGGGVVVIEWSERLARALPADRLEAHLTVLEGDRRRIWLEPLGPRSRDLLERARHELRPCSLVDR